MTLHDRLKPIEVEEQPASRGWHAVALGVVLAVFAAGFAVAMPLAMRPAGSSGERSPPGSGPLASPSSDPAAVTLPSPAAPARPEDDEVANAADPEIEFDVDEADPADRAAPQHKEVANPKTVTLPQPDDDKHGKRAPDDPGDHDKGYGNDPDRANAPKRGSDKGKKR